MRPSEVDAPSLLAKGAGAVEIEPVRGARAAGAKDVVGFANSRSAPVGAGGLRRVLT
jgi:hypothetical protein